MIRRKAEIKKKSVLASTEAKLRLRKNEIMELKSDGTKLESSTC